MKAPHPALLRTASVLLLLLLLFAAGCSSQDGSSQAGVRSVSQQELLSLSEEPTSVLILDVRSESEFASGHVPGAVNIPHDQLADRLDEVDGDREEGVIVYCESGRRASGSIATLNDAGVERVGHLVGDMRGWRAEELPTEN